EAVCPASNCEAAADEGGPGRTPGSTGPAQRAGCGGPGLGRDRESDELPGADRGDGGQRLLEVSRWPDALGEPARQHHEGDCRPGEAGALSEGRPRPICPAVSVCRSDERGWGRWAWWWRSGSGGFPGAGVAGPPAPAGCHLFGWLAVGLRWPVG